MGYGARIEMHSFNRLILLPSFFILNKENEEATNKIMILKGCDQSSTASF